MKVPPIIILEGPDGTGKTTLARHLVLHHGFRYHHEGPPPRGVDLITYYGYKLMRAATGRRPVVFDRFHLGERVYGPVARGVDRLGEEGERLLQRLIAAWGVRVVLCLVPLERCLEEWQRRHLQGQEYLTKREWFCQVYERFAQLATRYETYWWTEDASFPVCEQPTLVPRGLIGHLGTARYLMVGERVNAPVDLPFFLARGSSRYLNHALWDANFFEGEMAFANAYGLKGRANNLLRLAQQLPRFSHAVALGKVAAAACERASVPHRAVPHPQYWKRFHAKERRKYVQLLLATRRPL